MGFADIKYNYHIEILSMAYTPSTSLENAKTHYI